LFVIGGCLLISLIVFDTCFREKLGAIIDEEAGEFQKKTYFEQLSELEQKQWIYDEMRR